MPTVGSNNPFPSILVDESTAPSGPSSGYQRIYIDTLDNRMKRINSSSGITIIEGMVKIEEQAPSSTGTFTFSSLGAFNHLEVHWIARSDKAAVNAEDMLIRFNGDTGANYDTTLLYNSSGVTAAAFEAIGGSAGTIATVPAATAAAGRCVGGTMRISYYSSTSFSKNVRCDMSGAYSTVSSTIPMRIFGVTWRTVNAVTSLTVSLTSGNFVSGSKFTLYGLV